MISYENLWNVMKEKGVSQYTLIKKYGDVYKRQILDCNGGDIMEYIKDSE